MIVLGTPALSQTEHVGTAAQPPTPLVPYEQPLESPDIAEWAVSGSELYPHVSDVQLCLRRVGRFLHSRRSGKSVRATSGFFHLYQAAACL
jgi:hypothetical protein